MFPRFVQVPDLWFPSLLPIRIHGSPNPSRGSYKSYLIRPAYLEVANSIEYLLWLSIGMWADQIPKEQDMLSIIPKKN